MAVVQQYLILLFVGWASGISLYLAVALVGISGRMGWVDLPPGLMILTNLLVIVVALLMYAIEFLADKIPIVDSTWDSVHTFVRPAGASLVGFLAGTEYGPVAQTVFAVATGALALDTHALKASTRLAINTSPEPVSNVAVSVAEDSMVLAMFWFFVKHPIISAVLIILFVIASFFILRKLWRFVRRLFQRKIAEGNVTDQPSTIEPEKYKERLGH